MTCPRCHSPNLVQTPTPKGPHHAREECGDCGRFVRWVPKPESERIRRPAAHRDLVRKYGRGFCELCLIREGRLPAGQTLVGHHVIEYQDGGEPKRENVWILCTKCEKLVHLMRTWGTIRADQYTTEASTG